MARADKNECRIHIATGGAWFEGGISLASWLVGKDTLTPINRQPGIREQQGLESDLLPGVRARPVPAQLGTGEERDEQQQQGDGDESHG